MQNEPITTSYKAIMSSGDPVRIEATEIETVLAAVGRGSFIKVKQGIINPSFLVTIVEDVERRRQWLHDNKHGQDGGRGMESLEDVFKKTQPKLPGASPPGTWNGGTGGSLPGQSTTGG